MAVHTSKQRDEAAGEASVKVCPRCDSYIDPHATGCEHCGFEYSPQVREPGSNFDEVDPLYARPVPVEAVTYHAHHKPDRPASLRVTYRLPDRWLSEWLCLFHPGYAGEKAQAEWLARGGRQLPANIDEAVRLAPAVLRRPPAVSITETNGFSKPIPVWEPQALPADAPAA